jgi:hypothetical protein
MGLLHNLFKSEECPRRGHVESFVMRKHPVEVNAASRPTSNVDDRVKALGATTNTLAKVGPNSPTLWPFHLSDVTPLAWWRTMPADHLGTVELIQLRATMDKISVMKDRQWLAALRGDAPASIAIAIGVMPIDQVTLEVDLSMSALALCALDGSAGAALVLSHILRRTPLDHPFGRDLAASWLVLNLCRALAAKSNASASPRSQASPVTQPSRWPVPA